jgi:O-methyltransferase
MTSLAEELLGRHPIISDQVDGTELMVILRRLEHVLSAGTAGDVVEFGCYAGTTSLFLRRMLDRLASDKKLHVYDSFAGLPSKTAADASPAGEQFRAGELAAAKTVFTRNFRQAGLRLPIIHKGWFADVPEAAVPDTIAFAFLDGDFYESIRDSLRLVWPHLTPGAVVVVDDYQSEALPGTRWAVDEWLGLHGREGRSVQLRAEASLAILL